MRLKFRNPFKGGRAYLWFVLLGVIIAIFILTASNTVIHYTSTDEYCMSCHVHPHAEQSWKLSPHHDNSGGVIVHCVECHLPVEGDGYLFAKAKHGLTDLYGYMFKDTADFNWDEKSKLEHAKGFVYQSSCVECHENLFPTTLTTEGADAHLNYLNSEEEILCINCHLDVGHYDPNASHEHNMDFGETEVNSEIYTEPTLVTQFENFTEKIPGTSVSFEMVAIPGGTFEMGSPDKEALRDNDEGPATSVQVSDFFMAEIEVSWDEYLAFFNATSSQGRKENEEVNEEVDGITGPTPPWGAPDQGWGKGPKPAITMTWYAADVYCKWLTEVTGKTYRLPTEAEWEYAARGGTDTPYFFEGTARDYSSQGFFNKLFGPDTTTINTYVAYELNSESQTKDPEEVHANPYGLKNMLGNVAEFCSDYYAENAYSEYAGGIVENPTGPDRGREHVIRGGSFKSDAKDVRSAARDYTRTTEWLVTDPQMPKSIWWYSDAVHVGFRVVCEVDDSIEK